MKRYLLTVVAVVLPLLLIGCLRSYATEKVYDCGTPSNTVLIVSAHPAYVAHVMLTGEEATRGVRAGDADAPVLEVGVLVLRADGVLVIFGYKSDGACGQVLIPPDHAERVWRAIKSTGA